jgi:hypothetical protein
MTVEEAVLALMRLDPKAVLVMPDTTGALHEVKDFTSVFDNYAQVIYDPRKPV